MEDADVSTKEKLFDYFKPWLKVRDLERNKKPVQYIRENVKLDMKADEPTDEVDGLFCEVELGINSSPAEESESESGSE